MTNHSLRFALGSYVINIRQASKYYGMSAIVEGIKEDDRYDWRSIGIMYPPLILTLRLNDGTIIKQSEKYWYPCQK